MGLLRLILALSVVIIHANPLFGYLFFSADIAVHSFFIISGFYMALILHEKYVGKNGSYRLFITNRLLRIYPLYWVVLLLLFSLSLTEFLLVPSSDNAIKIMLRVASESENPIFTGLMMVLRNITLIFTADYFRDNFNSLGYLLLLTAWTLQVEVLFYLLAPLLMKLKLKFIMIMTVIFFWITFAHPFPVLLEYKSLTGLFLSNFVFFLFGIISYNFYRTLKTQSFTKKYSKKIVFFFFAFTFIFGFYSTNGNDTPQQQFVIFYFLIVMLSLPFVFYSTQKNSLDRTFADLSYPVYLLHLLVFKIIIHSPLQYLEPSTKTLVTIAVTLVFSWILVLLIEKPIDRLRKNMLE